MLNAERGSTDGSLSRANANNGDSVILLRAEYIVNRRSQIHHETQGEDHNHDRLRHPDQASSIGGC